MPSMSMYLLRALLLALSLVAGAAFAQNPSPHAIEIPPWFAETFLDFRDDVRDAAQQVAQAKGLKFVLTRQFVGYGGVDITPDVEKILQITERVTPAP